MIFYGINPVIESLKSTRRPHTIHIASHKTKRMNPGISAIRKSADDHGVSVKIHDDIQKLCGSREHQGVCAETDNLGIQPLSTHDLTAMRYVILDGIQDPHNFGAMLRVCDVFGFDTVVYHKGDSSGVTPAAIKASTGAVFHLNIFVSNINTALKRFVGDGYSICVLDSDGDKTLAQFEFPEKYCIIAGSEGKGVRYSVKRQADNIIKIPVSGKVNSLNVSCALTAALYEATRSGETHGQASSE